jgi:hypothetical protein
MIPAKNHIRVEKVKSKFNFSLWVQHGSPDEPSMEFKPGELQWIPKNDFLLSTPDGKSKRCKISWYTHCSPQ